MLKLFHLHLSLGLLFLCSCKSAKVETVDFSDGSYEGELNRKKQKHGKGFFRWSDGSYYNGDYLRDQRHGQGRFLWASGETYEGAYAEDRRTGKGIYRWTDGSVYEGSFFKGKRHGNGVFISADGIRYEGEWLHDLQHGKGKLSFPDGKTLSGEWIEGKLIQSNSSPPSTSPQPSISAPVPVIESVDALEADKPVKGTPSAAKEEPLKKSAKASPASPASTSKPSLPEPLPEKGPVDPTEATPPLPPASVSLPPPPSSPSPSKAAVQKIDSIDKEAKAILTPETASVWRGSAKDAESRFTTELVNGLDTIKDRKSNLPFSGKMQIVNAEGILEGELNLSKGLLHGKEIFYDSKGKIVEENLWKNGRRVN